MAPTIWGDHAKVVCRDCGIEFTANWQPEMRPTRPLPCWNCGGRLRTDQVTVQSGQLVSIDAVAYQVDRPKIGEVVAIRDALGTRIKRIVASPGQTISVRDGLLLRDEQVMTADVPWLLVHDDTHRLSNYSWWQSPDTGWAKTNSGFSITVQESAEQKSKVQPPILLYGHRSPYQGLKPDVVRDDYQGNLTEIRSLQPVNKLGLQFDIEVTVAATIELWNLTEDGYIKDLRSFDTGVHHVNAQWEKAIAEVEPCFNLDPKQPIGIRVTKGSAELRNLVVKRPCVYFSDERDGQSIRFPIRLAEDEYFVIGDNIPQSIDSRHTGPIKQSAILGKVVKTTESF